MRAGAPQGVSRETLKDEWFRVEHLGRESRVIAWSLEESWKDRVQALLDDTQ